jgi:proteasome accessory factor B
VARDKSERLLQLLLILQHSRPTKARLRQAIDDYAQAASDEAFERMFERDKQDLRDLGVPLNTVSLDPADENEVGYTVDWAGLTLPPIELSPDEAAAVAAAASLWRSTGAETAARTAALKVASGSEGPPALPDAGFALGQGWEYIPALTDAVNRRQPVRFKYRRIDATTAEQRTVRPWRVVLRAHASYLVAWDVDRNGQRAFRLNRLGSPPIAHGAAGSYDIPESIDLESTTRPMANPGVAELVVAKEAAWPLQRRAATVAPDDAGDDRRLHLSVEFPDREAFADELTGYGANVRVLQPPELIQALRTRLQALAVD